MKSAFLAGDDSEVSRCASPRSLRHRLRTVRFVSGLIRGGSFRCRLPQLPDQHAAPLMIVRGPAASPAVAALWWLARYTDGIALITSSTFRQVKTQLWSELHSLIAQATVPYPELKSTELKLRDDRNFALGFSTDRRRIFKVITAGMSSSLPTRRPELKPASGTQLRVLWRAAKCTL
jgi:hypothetical protein